MRKACDELREATRLNPNNAMAISELAKIIFRFGGDTPQMVNKRRALGIAKMKHAIQIESQQSFGFLKKRWKKNRGEKYKKYQSTHIFNHKIRNLLQSQYQPNT